MKLINRVGLIPLTLWTVTIASFALALKTTNEPVLEIFTNTWVDKWFRQFATGNSIIFDLSTGSLVTVFFYLLVVWLPDRQKKNLIRTNFKEQYRYFKEDTISILLRACTGAYDSELPGKLVDQGEFRNYFQAQVNAHQTRWHAALNGLDDRLSKELLVELELLMNEVGFVLNNVSINDRDVFAFFKRLSHAVYKLKLYSPNYGDDKQLAGLIWELFAGWSFIDGYRNDDIIAVMIAKI